MVKGLMMMMMMMQRQLRVHFAGNAKEVTFRLAVISVYLFFIAVCSVLFKGTGRGITILIFECSCPTVCSMIISPFFFKCRNFAGGLLHVTCEGRGG